MKQLKKSNLLTTSQTEIQFTAHATKKSNLLRTRQRNPDYCARDKEIQFTAQATKKSN